MARATHASISTRRMGGDRSCAISQISRKASLQQQGMHQPKAPQRGDASSELIRSETKAVG